MAGKRLAAAGLLAAAVAAAAALLAAPHSALAPPAHGFRQVRVIVENASPAHVPVAAVQTVARGLAHSPAGVTTAVVCLVGVALLFAAPRPRRQPAPVVVRLSRRGRAPPARRTYR